MSSDDSHFVGWIGEDEKCIGNMEWKQFTPKKWTEDDVELKIECCGICASDNHTASSGWGPANHEIVGKATRVGKNVKHVSVGQRVGIGAQSGSCLKCDPCKSGHEPYCDKGQIGTYNGVYPDGQGQSQGGYAKYGRYNGHFVVPIPDGLDSKIAAVLMCGGVTVYSPLKENGAGQEGFKRVGISGIGGLGHMGVLFAKALGAEKITAISHTHSKEELANKLGATDFLATADGDEAWKKHAKSLDIVIVTNNNPDMPIDKYLSLCRRGGKVIHVGAPEKPVQAVPIFNLIFTGVTLGGSAIGGIPRIKEMLDLAVEQKITPLIEARPMSELNQASKDMDAGKPRFRYVMVNED